MEHREIDFPRHPRDLRCHHFCPRRERRLTAVELTGRLRALDALASGKLPPPLASVANPLPRKSRSPVHCINPVQC